MQIAKLKIHSNAAVMGMCASVITSQRIFSACNFIRVRYFFLQYSWYEELIDMSRNIGNRKLHPHPRPHPHYLTFQNASQIVHFTQIFQQEHAMNAYEMLDAMRSAKLDTQIAFYHIFCYLFLCVCGEKR